MEVWVEILKKNAEEILLKIEEITSSATKSSFHFEGQPNFVATSIEVAAVDEGGEGDGDPIPELLLVAEPDLTLVVYLCPYSSPVLQDILGPDAKAGRGAGAAPAQVDPGLQGRAHLLVHGSSKVSAVGDAGVEDEVRGGVADAEVVLGDGRLAEVKTGLVAGKPALVSHDSGGIDGGQSEVHVGGEGGGFMLVFSFELTRLRACRGGKAGVQGDLEAGEELVGNVQGSVEGVVGGPFLSQCQAKVLHLVLGLQVAGHLAAVDVRAAPTGELHSGVSLGLHLQLEETKVVTLAKNISGLFS